MVFRHGLVGRPCTGHQWQPRNADPVDGFRPAGGGCAYIRAAAVTHLIFLLDNLANES
jgi:hypothetical protein